MSLIGSLEDLGLGDILQIISLSQKSGVLVIRSESGQGRIVFRDGLVRGACIKGGPSDLRSVLVGGGFLSETDFEVSDALALQGGVDVLDLLAQRPGLSRERIDSLLRESVEAAVGEMFGWGVGDFSFDMREESDPEDPPVFVPGGINAQYLAMECSRVGDEADRDFGGSDEEGDTDSMSAEELFGVVPDETPAPAPADDHDEAVELVPVEGSEHANAETGELLQAELVEVVAEASVAAATRTIGVEDERAAATHAIGIEDERAAATPAIGVEAERAAATPARRASARPPVVVIDADLAALEWVKSVLASEFSQVHIFQHSEQGLGRIRQYLARGQLPCVLLAPDTPADRLSGIHGACDLVKRLKAQARRMPILWLCEDGAEPIGRIAPADGAVTRPAAYQFQNRNAGSRLEEVSSALRAGVVAQLERTTPGESEEGRSISPEVLERLKQATAVLREASSRGEVLPLVICFAAETLARVAMFVVRDGELTGMAQRGLEKAGGPADEALRHVRARVASVPEVRQVLETRAPRRGPVTGEGDRALVCQLGQAVPQEVYWAPIESAGQVVALLYGDNLPEGRPLGDTSALEVVLHHAGLALDRAALERALQESDL